VPDAPAEAVACRADALLAVLQYKLAGNRHLGPEHDGPGKAFTATVGRHWDARWPGGLALPEGDVPNRVPLTAPLDPHVPLSEAEAIRLTTVAREFEPFEPRPPHEVWKAPTSPEQGRRLVQGLAEFLAGADIQRLDALLWQQDASTMDIEGMCEVATVDLANDRREVRLDCPGPDGLALQGYVQLRGDAITGGAISRLQMRGQVVTNLKIAGGRFEEAGGQGRLLLELEERAADLHARLPDGDAIRALAVGWSLGDEPASGVAIARVSADFEILYKAVATMQERTATGASDALGAAPMRRVALMSELFAALGAEPIDWCCLDDTAMPAAALEP
jgi:hypothetical protein